MDFNAHFFKKKLTLEPNPGCVFLLFVSINALLSYFSFSLTVKLWIGMVGLATPAYFTLRKMGSLPAKEKNAFETELFPNFPGWGFWVVAALALLPRFYQLTGLSVWPFTDEGYNSYASIGLLKKWTWNFFFTFSQNPPFYYWLQAFFFRWITPSLASLWFFSALVSVLTVWLGCLAARLFFSRSFSLFCLLFIGFSFWPLYAGRVCQPVSIILFWQVLALLFLSLFLKHRFKSGQWKYALALGIVTGLGFYGAVVWLVMAVSIGFIFLRGHWHPGDQRKAAFCFWGGLLATSAPFFLISLFERNGQYLKAVWAFYPGMDLKQQAIDVFSNIQALLWGFDWRRLYGPVWGGLLNPVLGALFFTGLLEVLLAWRSSFSRWVLLSLGVFLLPVLVARGYDSFRILHLFPLVALLSAAGLQAVLASLGSRKRVLTAIVIVGFSTGLDFCHLFDRFHHAWGTPGNTWNFGKEYELWKSYEILSGMDKKIGPGALLFDLRTHLDDVTPAVAAYSFDATQNPSLSFPDARWVALLLDANYLPFLSKRFPEGMFYWLCPKEPYGRWALGIIPIRPGNKAILERWFDLNQEMQAVTLKIINTMPGTPRKAILEQIARSSDKVAGDPFLESVYWEKIFDNRLLDRDGPGCLEAAQKCVLKGYPLAEMYNEEGVILVQTGQYQRARKAFEKAARTDVLELTPARQNIQALEAAGK